MRAGENATAPPTVVATTRPLIGIAAVLVGAIVSTLYGRVTTFGLADIRGAVHAGVDEGAWILTAGTMGQMLMGVLSVWLGAAFGPRRVLSWGTAVFGTACLVIPFAPDLKTLLVLQFVAGLGSGTYVPLAIGFVLKHLVPRYQVFGIAAYAMSLELSQNVPASLEGFYLDHGGWRWIFWQHAVVAPLLWVLIRAGMPRMAPDRPVLAAVDGPGIVYLGVGASLAYAALDQADRLDWFGSGLITGLSVAAMFLLGLFVHRELTTEHPFFDIRSSIVGNLPKLAVILTLYRFLVLATAYVLPQFLVQVQGYRALDIGHALLWIAAPQFLLAPLVALALRRVDARIVMSLGFTLIGAACLMVAHGLTRDWISADFVPSQLLQAIGQSCALTAFVWFATRHLIPTQALTFGAFIQTFRLLGGEIGTSAMTWLARAGEQFQSNVLGTHVVAGSGATAARVAGIAASVSGRVGSGSPSAALSLLARSVRQQAYTLAFVDAMTIIAIVAAVCLIVVSTLKAAPVVVASGTPADTAVPPT